MAVTVPELTRIVVQCGGRSNVGRLIHFRVYILIWRCSWDGGVQKISQVHRYAALSGSYIADCFGIGNYRSNQRIWATESLLSLPRMGNSSFNDSLLFCRVQRYLAARVVCEWRRHGPSANQFFLIFLALNPRVLLLLITINNTRRIDHVTQRM